MTVNGSFSFPLCSQTNYCQIISASFGFCKFWFVPSHFILLSSCIGADIFFPVASSSIKNMSKNKSEIYEGVKEGLNKLRNILCSSFGKSNGVKMFTLFQADPQFQ